MRRLGCLMPMPAKSKDVDPDRAAIGAFNMKFMGMVQNATVLAVASVADKTGLFKLLADAGRPLTVDEICSTGKMHPRYVLEVCSCLACAEFLAYDKENDTFTIEPAQAKLLTDPNFALTVGGWCGVMPALYMAVPGEPFRSIEIVYELLTVLSAPGKVSLRQ